LNGKPNKTIRGGGPKGLQEIQGIAADFKNKIPMGKRVVNVKMHNEM